MIHGQAGLFVRRGLHVNMYLLAGLHGDCEWDGFETRDEVEGAFFWDCFEALRRVGTDDEGAVWLCDPDGFWVGLVYCLG